MQQQRRQDDGWRQTVARLDAISRLMNPVLLLVAILLVVLNLACVVNLIDWRAPPPAAVAAPPRSLPAGSKGASITPPSRSAGGAPAGGLSPLTNEPIDASQLA